MKCPHCGKKIIIKRTKSNFNEPIMTDLEAQIKIVNHIQNEFKKGNKKLDNLSVFIGLKREVTFKQINDTLDILEKNGAINGRN